MAPNLGVRGTLKGAIVSAGRQLGLHKSPLHGQLGMETSQEPQMPSAHHPRGGQPQVPCRARAPTGARSEARPLLTSAGTRGGGRSGWLQLGVCSDRRERSLGLCAGEEMGLNTTATVGIKLVRE